MEALLSVEVSGAPLVTVLVDVSALEVLTALLLVVTVAALTLLPPLELWLSLLVVLVAELVPPADAASDAELLDTCPLPFALAVSGACSPEELPPPPQAHTRTHANGLCRTQLMHVNFAPHLARRKQALIERAKHILSSSLENRDHSSVLRSTPSPARASLSRTSQQRPRVTTFNEISRAFHER